jgi:hypothetical protein
MSNRYAEIVVLAEDERSANLLRRYVQRALQINNRGIRQIISPSGRGDAKQWVIGQYPIEVKAFRARHRLTGLLVHLDADKETVPRRATQLADALKKNGLDDRAASERISHAIPRRHTETWLCVLTGVNVDEEQDCKRGRLIADFDGAVSQAAIALYQSTRPNAPAPAIPSLNAVVPELRRLES